MYNYCPKCGKQLNENFKFCPSCGLNLEEKFQYCPECGKKFLPSDKAEKPYSKKEKRQFSFPKFPKIPVKKPSRNIMIIIALVCIVIVVAASLYYFYPFGTGGSSYGGRTFVVTIENSYVSSVECYFTVGGLRYSDTAFTMTVGETLLYEIVEDDLNPILLSSDYDIVLFVTVGDLIVEAPAYNVTESAEFSIYESNGQHAVDCTSSS